MNRRVRVRDLPSDPQGRSLHCPGCDQLWSAHRGDYFLLPPSRVMTCGHCDTPLRMVRIEVRMVSES